MLTKSILLRSFPKVECSLFMYTVVRYQSSRNQNPVLSISASNLSNHAYLITALLFLQKQIRFRRNWWRSRNKQKVWAMSMTDCSKDMTNYRLQSLWIDCVWHFWAALSVCFIGEGERAGRRWYWRQEGSVDIISVEGRTTGRTTGRTSVNLLQLGHSLIR